MKKNFLNNEIFEVENDLNYSNITNLDKNLFNILISTINNKNINANINKNDLYCLLINIFSNNFINNKKTLFISSNEKDTEIILKKIKLENLNNFFVSENIEKNKLKYIPKVDIDKEKLIEIKSRLNQYVESLSSYPLNFDLSNQEILFLKVFYEEITKSKNENIFNDGKEINNNKLKIENNIIMYIDKIEDIKIHLDLKNITEHSWYGIQRFYSPSDKAVVESKINKLKEDNNNAKDKINEIEDKYKIINKKDLSDISKRFDLLYRLLNYNEKEKKIILDINRENKNNIERITKKIEKNRKNIDYVKSIFNVNELKNNYSFHINIENIINDYSIKNLTVEEIIKIQEVFNKNNKSINSISKINSILSIDKNLEKEYQLLDSINVINEVLKIDNIKYIKYKNKNYMNLNFEEIFKELILKKEILKEKFLKLNQKISMKSILEMDLKDFKYHVKNYKNYNFLYKFSKKKKSYDFIKNNWQETLLINNKKYIKNTLDEVILYIEESNNFKTEEKYIDFFGDVFKGVETNISIIKELKNWHNNIELKTPINLLDNDLNYLKIKYIKELVNPEELKLLKDILLNISVDKSKNILDYSLSFKKKIINYILQSGSLNNAIVNINKIHDDIEVIDFIVNKKDLKIENLSISFNDYLIVLDVEKEINMIEDFKYFKDIDLFNENLIKLNFMFNKIFQTINKNSSFFTGYKNKINEIIKNNNLNEVHKIKSELLILMETNENNFKTVRNYFKPETTSNFLKYSSNVEDNEIVLNNLKLNLKHYSEYSKLFEIKNKLINFNLKSLLLKIDNNKLSKEDSINIINYETYNLLSNIIISKNKTIGNFNENEYLEMINDYKKLDKTLLLNNKKDLNNKLINEKINNNKTQNIIISDISSFKNIDSLEFDLLIFNGTKKDFNKLNIKYKNILLLNAENDIKNLEIDEIHKIEEKEKKSNTDQKLEKIINKYLDKEYKYNSILDNEVNGIITKNNQPVIFLKLDDEKYYKIKYMKDRDLYIGEKYKNLEIHNLWTPNLYHDLEGEMEAIKRKLINIKRIT
jgi:hypothetical protein